MVKFGNLTDRHLLRRWFDLIYHAGLWVVVHIKPLIVHIKGFLTIMLDVEPQSFGENRFIPFFKAMVRLNQLSIKTLPFFFYEIKIISKLLLLL